MTYQKPELFLVGAAQGLVLGAAPVGSIVDSHYVGTNCPDGSRDFAEEGC